MKRTHCKECNRKIKDKERLVFCSKTCSYRFHSKIFRKKAKEYYEYNYKIEIKFKNRKCLKCHKLFKSWGIGNRRCSDCNNSPEYKNLHDLYVFEPLARRR